MISPLSPLLRRVTLFVLVGAAVLIVQTAPAAWADEIVYRDGETCEEITVKVPQIASETWTEIRYRERPRGPELSIPTALVIEVRRDPGSDAQARDLLASIEELERGNLTEARRALQSLSGGGYVQNLETGELEFKSFTEGDPPGRRKRPPWTSEYAHFYYARALFEEGSTKDDKDLLREAYLALVDQKIPGATDDKARTGGFLGRFEGGNSRFYPDAMLLTARTLGKLKRYKEAAKAYKDLGDKALAVDIGPRWAYEARIGPAELAEAQGKHLDAIVDAEDTANFMKLLLTKETRGCVSREIGRLYSRARMLKAGIMLRQAEKNKNPAEFRSLKQYIEESSPQALRKAHAALPARQLEALVAGAMDPAVQAVAQNGLGLAYLNGKEYEKAILAFRSVEVKYFHVPEEHARALYYLAQTADEAAKKASGTAQALYSSYRDQALERLKKEYPSSTWVRGR